MVRPASDTRVYKLAVVDRSFFLTLQRELPLLIKSLSRRRVERLAQLDDHRRKRRDRARVEVRTRRRGVDVDVSYSFRF